MGKRTANGVNASSPKKMKKESDYSDSDADPDTVDERDEDTTAFFGSFEPDNFRHLVEEFEEFVGQRNDHVKSMEKLLVAWVEKRREENKDIIDIVEFERDFRRHLKTAMKVSNLPVTDALLITKHYLEKPDALTSFSDYPRKPQAAIRVYIERKKLPKSVADLSAAHEEFKKDTSGLVAECHEEVKRQEINCAGELQAFLEKHPELTSVQKTHINHRISLINKKTSDTPVRQRNSGGAKGSKALKKEPETAFSLYCKTMKDKWTDLSSEAREHKLKKKFNKLDVGQLQLLESLALNS